MTSPRTPKQIAADKLDVEMSTLCANLLLFAAVHDDRQSVETARLIGSLRSRVRANMHPRDREETNQ